MKHPAAVCALLILSAFALLLPLPAPAQAEAAAPTEDAELEAAALARRESADFARRMAELDEANQALEDAITSIPDVQAIDTELTRLRRLIRELVSLRQDVIDQHAQTIEPMRLEVKRAEQDLAAADPVRQVIKRRRLEAALEPVEPLR